MAQRIRHLTTNQGIVGSNPTRDVFFLISNQKFIIRINKSYEHASMAQLAERSAVNRQVLGSIPSGGASFFSIELDVLLYFWKVKNGCRHRGSNLGPSDLQSDALPTEL